MVIMCLDLEDFDEKYIFDIFGFYKGLIEVLLSLVEYCCLFGVKGGFLSCVEKGILMGYVIEYVVLEF